MLNPEARRLVTTKTIQKCRHDQDADNSIICRGKRPMASHPGIAHDHPLAHQDARTCKLPIGGAPSALKSLPTLQYADYGGRPRQPITGRHRDALARHLMHVKIAALVQRPSGRCHWTLARRGPQSLLISSSLLLNVDAAICCREGGDHALTKLAQRPSHHSKPPALVPGRAGLDLLLARNPALRLPARRRGSFLTNIYKYFTGNALYGTATRYGPPATQSAIDVDHTVAAVARCLGWRLFERRRG
ncbi:uncharacterized protein TrAtP1_001992 [Trichoderma atroviride]|uniref:uncharacterized protein n=1 Tax=Hypocrea atroviridis TaxID=63577 RepID=UPI0033306E8D|nr:hypothetical protein TrAtP1_001992 [Trichoderma atroviride]